MSKAIRPLKFFIGKNLIFERKLNIKEGEDNLYYMDYLFGHPMLKVRLSIDDPICMYTPEYVQLEKWFYRNKGFLEILNSKDYAEKFRNLVKNLDEESAATVLTSLKRLKLYLTSNEPYPVIPDKAERKQLLKVYADMSKHKTTFPGHFYCYKNYFLPISQFEESVFYYKHALDHLHNLEKIKGRDIMDVGGFVGDSTLVFQPLQAQHIYSFEATQQNYQLLLKTIQLNELKNVYPQHLALGSEQGEIKISTAGSGSSCNPLLQYGNKFETVPMDTLDNFVQANNCQVGLIKVDIEGFEQNFLQGAKQTIQTQKPILLLSIYHNASDYFNIKPIIESWNLNYTFQIVHPCNGSVIAETLLVAEVL